MMNEHDEHDDEQRPPTQEDIWDGITIDQAKVRVNRGIFGTKIEDGWVARARDHVVGRELQKLLPHDTRDPLRVASATTERALFAELRVMGERMCFPRIFSVNDHGNVTEYAYSGKIIGEWV